MVAPLCGSADIAAGAFARRLHLSSSADLSQFGIGIPISTQYFYSVFLRIEKNIFCVLPWLVFTLAHAIRRTRQQNEAPRRRQERFVSNEGSERLPKRQVFLSNL